MKLEKIKHNHSLTELLKVIIFSILMLLPFLSIGTRCLYVICNKNAYQSYSGTTTQYTRQGVYEQGTQQDIATGTVQKIYHCDFEQDDNLVQDFFTPNYDSGGILINIINGSLNFLANTYYIDEMIYPVELNNQYLQVELGNDSIYTQSYNSTNLNGYYTIMYEEITLYESHFDFIILENNNGESMNTNRVSVTNYQEYEYTEIESSTLDNVFDYSVEQMTNSPTFNWTQNTALYTGVKGMTDNLQVQTNLIAVLIVYWTILTIIYIILDIVLKMFEWLTHGLIKKS